MPLIRKPDVLIAAPPADLEGALDALTRGTTEERWLAARQAAQLPASARALGAALAAEQDMRVRETIFTSLVAIGTAESTEQLLPFLRSDDAPLRGGALDALRAMRGAVLPRLAQLFQDPDSDVRLLACELTRNLPSEQASRLLCTLLTSEREENVCASAIEVLAEVGDGDAVPALAQCASRFENSPFLQFAIKATIARLRAQPSASRE